MFIKPLWPFFSAEILLSVFTFCNVLVEQTKLSDKSKFQKLVNIFGKVMGQQQLSLSNIYDRQVFKKAKQISTAHTFGLLNMSFFQVRNVLEFQV